jgi:hypothetical protein
MKRLLLVLTAGLAMSTVIAGTGTGAPPDAKGPPCTNILDNLETDYYNPAENPDLVWTFVLGGRSCESVTYTLRIYTLDSFNDPTPTLLATLTHTGDGSSNQVVFTHNFPEGTAPADGVCLTGTTTRRGAVVDTAPDSANCLPFEVGGASGGFG